MDTRTRDRYGLLALILYIALASFFFGRGLVGRFSTYHIGEGADPSLMIWCLVWWPHAIAKGLNPFLTTAFWAPSGFNLAWSSSIPLISLVAAPITTMFGPIASLNICCLLGVSLDAWCTFLLCRSIGAHYWASVLGGYIFGFCPMILGQLLFARLHTTWVFPVPVVVYLLLLRLRGDIGNGLFRLALVATLATQFYCSIEIFATMTLIGAIVLALVWLQSSGELRKRLSSISINVLASYGAVLVVVSPYLYFMFFSDRPFTAAMWPAHSLSADLLNLAIPAPTSEMGLIPLFDRISAPFNFGVPAEQGGFLSWPLVAIAVLYASDAENGQLCRLVAYTVTILVVFSLGAHLMVRGLDSGVALPWTILTKSIFKNATPARFSMYTFLIFAVIASLWMSARHRTMPAKFAIAALIIICQIPNLSMAYWIERPSMPDFFGKGLYRDYIPKGASVFILPVWPRNDSMLWQAETGMYFNLGQGPAAWPAKVANWPIVSAFDQQMFVPDPVHQLEAYLFRHDVSLVIADDDSLATWGTLLSGLHIVPVRAYGVSLYRLVPPSIGMPPVGKMRTDFDTARLNTLLIALQKYVGDGGELTGLRAENILHLGLIPDDSVIGPPPAPELRMWRHVPYFRYGIFLFAAKGDVIVLGEYASRPVAEALIEKYRATATEVDFVPPRDDSGPKDEQIGAMVMSFNREQLKQAAEIAETSKVFLNVQRGR